MTDIYGMVGGFKHSDGDRDCSRPCMFLDGVTCRLDGSEAMCLAHEEPEKAETKAARLWTDDEIALLESGKTVREVAEITGRTIAAVSQKRHNIAAGKKDYWNSREIELIYIWRNDKKVAELTGRTVKACKVKRQKLRVPHEEVQNG